MKANFKTDELGLAIYALATKKHPMERLVIMESSILDVIQEEHSRIGHAGVHATWAAVSKGFYGIIQSEVMWLLKRCQICIRRASN